MNVTERQNLAKIETVPEVKVIYQIFNIPITPYENPNKYFKHQDNNEELNLPAQAE